jgi:hypothetical protein
VGISGQKECKTGFPVVLSIIEALGGGENGEPRGAESAGLIRFEALKKIVF